MKRFFTKPNTSLIAVVLLLCIACAMLFGCDDSGKISYESAVVEVLPGVDLSTGKDVPIDSAEYPESVKRISEYDIGYAIETEVFGKYRMKVLVGISKGGAITGVCVTENEETSSHFKKIESTLIGNEGKYNGVTSDSLNAEIVSGATLSSNGIYDAVKASLEVFEILNANKVDANNSKSSVEVSFTEALYAVNELIENDKH